MATLKSSDPLVSAAATRLRPIEVADLALREVSPWRGLRQSLERRRAMRTKGRRFRRDPVAYLASLEDALIKQALPS